MSAPFIGSRISLISKSDVRYEGILCGIDTNESKVYLQHVRCFGTEDRRKENPIAPATEVYEVIIFHSSDIKDLSVCELPPPVAYDPMSFNSFSHVGSGYPPQYGYPPMVHPQYGPQYGYPYGPYGHNYGMYPQSPSMMGPQDNAGAYPNAPGDQANEKPASLSVQPPQKINVTTTKVDANAQAQSSSSSEPHPADNKETNDAQTHNADNHNNDNAKAEVTTSDESHSQKSNNFHNKNQNNNQNKRNNNRNNNFVYLPKGEAQRNNQSEKSNDNTPNNNGQQADSSSANTSNSDQQNNRQNNHNNQSDYRQKRGNSNNRGYKSHYNNNRRGFDSRGHHNSSDQSHFHKPKEQSEPKSQEDFDFLISNSKFEKLSISALPGELDKELPKISPSYNKDSFYDNISCDTLDREDQKDKKSYYEQRKLDSETFGDLGRRTSNNRGRTRGRYDTHSQNNNQNNYSGNSNNQRRYNNNYNNNNRGNRNYRGNKNASGNTSNNASDNTAQN